MLPALETEEGATNRGIKRLLEAAKGKEIRNAALPQLDFSPVKPISDF